MWLSPDQTRAEGRWFWGQYQEFGIDVELRRPSPGAMLLGIDRQSVKIGSQSVSVQLIGENIPARVTPRDLNLGQGINVRRILSHSSKELVVEVDVASNAALGARDVSLFDAILEAALVVYDRVDYIRATPESSMAAFGSSKYPRGFQVFEAIGYQRGPDGKPHTADDLELGPVDVTWSMEVFYALDASGNDKVGEVTPGGLLVPSQENPGANYDIWVVATATKEMNQEGTPLVGKGYVVVTVPEYTFNGHHYVRDLERWIEDGAW
jgi:quinohemoprotein amine dehydrogenase